MANKKATEDQFNELHLLVTKEFLSRIKSGEASTQDLKAACTGLKPTTSVVSQWKEMLFLNSQILCQK